MSRWVGGLCSQIQMVPWTTWREFWQAGCTNFGRTMRTDWIGTHNYWNRSEMQQQQTLRIKTRTGTQNWSILSRFRRQTLSSVLHYLLCSSGLLSVSSFLWSRCFLNLRTLIKSQNLCWTIDHHQETDWLIDWLLLYERAICYFSYLQNNCWHNVLYWKSTLLNIRQ